MNQPRIASIASVEDRIGRLAARHLDTTFRHLSRHPSRVSTTQFLRVVSGEPNPFGNYAVIADGEDAEAVRAAVGPLLGREFPACVLFPGERVGAEANAFLQEAGFGFHGPMPAMAVDIGQMGNPTLPEGYRFTRAGEEEAGPWLEAFASGYELPMGTARLFSPEAIGIDPAPDADSQFFLIYGGERAVCTSFLYLQDGVAGIYCVATRPEERGKGLGAFATAGALWAAERLGYRVGVLQSSAMGHSVYRRLGFVDCGGVPLYLRLP